MFVNNNKLTSCDRPRGFHLRGITYNTHT